MEIRFPVVEGYAFSLKRNSIRCDVDSLEGLSIEPSHVPTATFVRATVGFVEGTPGQVVTPFGFEEQDREEFYGQTHLQTIKFQLAQHVLAGLLAGGNGHDSSRERVLRLQSRHQLFPQVYRFVDEYVTTKVAFNDAHPCELGLEKYFKRVAERIQAAIEPDDAEGEPPLLPVLNRHKPIGTTAEVDFKTTRPCHATFHSHINQIVLDTHSWEQAAAFHLESSPAVAFYARNDRTALVIPYEYEGVPHSYLPDYLVRLSNGVTLILEIKGYETEQTKAKHVAARRWVAAVNNWGQLGRWAFHVCRNPQSLPRELAEVLQALDDNDPARLEAIAARPAEPPTDGLFAKT
jgi:type III restriction enzyme